MALGTAAKKTSSIPSRNTIGRRCLMTGLMVVVLFFVRADASSSVDAKTRDLLIQKLTQVHLNLAPNDPSRVGIALRLADLLAERARLAAMAEIEKGCTACNAADADRQAALKLYLDSMGKVPVDSQGKVRTQVGHLYELLGREAEALAMYRQIVAMNASPHVKAEAQLSLAEMFFKKRNFATARDHYQAVLDIPQAHSRGLAAYRRAWCLFNLGDLGGAVDGLTLILKTPELLTRSGAPGIASIDRQFQDEVSRDLATFFSRRAVTVADAKTLFELSPESTRLANISYLATELERVGQLQASVDLWRFVQERQSRPLARLEGQVRLAQMEMQLGHQENSLKDYDGALSLWATMGGCNESACSELKTRLRKFILDWNRVEKKAPTAPLLATYQKYLSIFGDESDMRLWAAQVATQLKDFDAALALYRRAVEGFSATIKASQTRDPKLAAETKTALEAALLGAVEAAELSKNPAHLDTGYALYLDYSLERKKAVEVRYQKAHLLYEKNDYGPAAQALRDVALSSDADAQDVKEKAADLALDSLVLAKNDALIESWAQEFAQRFPAKSDEFLALARKSVLNQAANVGTDDTHFESAWNVLSRYPVQNASVQEQTAYYKNRLILAEKLGKFGDAREAVERLLKLPNVPEVDRQYALSRQAWLAELVLDFDGALTATEKMAPTQFMVSGQKWLKLALYADLASKDPRPFYEKYIKESKDATERRLIAARLVRDSAKPVQELERQRTVLAGDAELLARLTLEIYAKTGQTDLLKKAIKDTALLKTASGRALGRLQVLAELEPLKTRFEKAKLDGSNQKKLAAGLKERMASLTQLEKLTEQAVQLQDWTAQLATLNMLGHESDRFYQEILQLPVPAGLAPEEEQQYLTLLSQQASPHQVRAQDVAKKVAEFWTNENAVEQLRVSYQAERGPLRDLLAKELAWIEAAAPEAKKASLAAIRSADKTDAVNDGRTPARDALEGARRLVRENPMNRESLEHLLELEKAGGRDAMVVYLQTRLSQLNETSSGKDANAKEANANGLRTEGDKAKSGEVKK